MSDACTLSIADSRSIRVVVVHDTIFYPFHKQIFHFYLKKPYYKKNNMAHAEDDKKKKESFMSKYKMYIIVAVVLVIAGAGYWHFVHNKHSSGKGSAGASMIHGESAKGYAHSGSAVPQMPASSAADKFRFY
jgi:hypothetical protein